MAIWEKLKSLKILLSEIQTAKAIKIMNYNYGNNR